MDQTLALGPKIQRSKKILVQDSILVDLPICQANPSSSVQVIVVIEIDFILRDRKPEK